MPQEPSGVAQYSNEAKQPGKHAREKESVCDEHHGSATGEAAFGSFPK